LASPPISRSAPSGTDANVAGAALTGEDDLAVTVRLDRLSLVTLSSNNSAAAAAVTELAVLLGDQQPAGRQDPIALARRFGVPVYEGNITLVADDSFNYPSDALARFLSFAGLALDPSVAEGQPDNKHLMAMMNTSQRIRVFGSTDSYSFQSANEFDRRRRSRCSMSRSFRSWSKVRPAFRFLWWW
jgi:hypothetical protein